MEKRIRRAGSPSPAGHRQIGMLGLLVVMLLPYVVRADELPSARIVIRFNSAVRLLNDSQGDIEKLDQAESLFRSLLEQTSQYQEINLSCEYYLGLVYLEKGLAASAERAYVAGNLAKLETIPPSERTSEQVEQIAELSRQKIGGFKKTEEQFGLARGQFQKVIDKSGPDTGRSLAIQAALDIGIATLGSEGADEDEAARILSRDLAEQAKEALSRYKATERGKVDPLGWFFLGMAYYRLNDATDGGRAYLDDAMQSFEEANRLSRIESGVGDDFDPVTAIPPLSNGEEQFASFYNRIEYYKALVQIARRDLAGARSRFESLTLTAAKTDSQENIVGNSKFLIGKIDSHRGQKTDAITIPKDVVPFGPLSLEGEIRAQQGFDSNVILLGNQTILPRRIVKEFDYTYGVSAAFDIYRTLYPEDGIKGESLQIGIGGQTFNIWQPSIDEFNINTESGRAYIQWEPVDNVLLGLQYDFSYTRLGSEPFISSNRITPTLSYLWDIDGVKDRARTDLFYSFDYRDYFDDISRPEFDRDGAYHSIGLFQSFNVKQARELWPDYYAGMTGSDKEFKDADRWLELSIGYLYRNERTQGDEFDLFANALVLGMEIPLPYRLAFDFRSEFSWDNYTRSSLLDFRRRERFDFIQRYRVGLSRTFIGRGEYEELPSLEVKGRLGVDMTFQDSNVVDRLGQQFFSFDRAIYGMEFAISF